MSIELALLGEIVSLAEDPNCDLGRFEARVASSPRLARDVTRIANSALYGMAGRITRLDRAVLILGRRAVADMAAGAAVAARLAEFADGPVPVDALWTHSLTIAHGARLLARFVRSPLDAEAYLLGLLHDLAIPEVAADASAVDPRDHAQALASSAREWGFPPTLCEAIASHHQADAASGDAGRLARLARAAHGLALAELVPFDDDPADRDERDGRLRELGLDAEDVAELREALEQEIKEAAAVLPAPRQGSRRR